MHGVGGSFAAQDAVRESAGVHVIHQLMVGDRSRRGGRT
jgi:hypothetical protein